MKLSAACAFVVGTVALDIGSTISTTEAVSGGDNFYISTELGVEEDNDTEATAVAAKSTKKPKKKRRASYTSSNNSIRHVGSPGRAHLFH